MCLQPKLVDPFPTRIICAGKFDLVFVVQALHAQPSRPACLPLHVVLQPAQMWALFETHWGYIYAGEKDRLKVHPGVFA